MHARFNTRYRKAQKLILRQAHCNIFSSCFWRDIISVHLSVKTIRLERKSKPFLEVWLGQVTVAFIFLHALCMVAAISI